ncbi:1-phosphofructokinase family hexose kinase [Ensifer adhaerens]|uniref:1-phosphofructokinase family hexose kinase n=1 Tax=Ensifer adhaerens TaxID=106592 RepID=UPI000DC23EC5|nr:hexose kinase [Ensifer adhaerens]RAS08291.1 6-phosphofructokinase [Ensifer adhaerens]
MSILAIALNPTIDVWSRATRIHPTVKVRTHDVQQRPGGGGVNVARVIATLGGNAELIVLAGGATGAILKDALAVTAIRLHPRTIAGATRISFMVREEETGLEYRFVPEGPEICADDVSAVLGLVDKFQGNYLVASGSLPRNAPVDVYAEIARCAAKKGAKVILDCPGATLRDTLGKAVFFLIKPSLEELETLAGHRLDENGVAKAASALVRDGASEFVAVTLGREGALLAGAFGTLRVPSKHVVAKSTVGAGDSFIGGLVWFLEAGGPMEDAFRFGIAAGTAAVMAAGSELCKRQDVFDIYGEGWLPKGAE